MTEAQTDAKSAYVVWVDFVVDPAHMAQFETLLHANVRATLVLEPGCRRFDVLRPVPAESGISLYEIYDDEAAFQAHLASDHYKDFDTLTANTVRSKTVRTFLLQPG